MHAHKGAQTHAHTLCTLCTLCTLTEQSACVSCASARGSSGESWSLELCGVDERRQAARFHPPPLPPAAPPVLPGPFYPHIPSQEGLRDMTNISYPNITHFILRYDTHHDKTHFVTK